MQQTHVTGWASDTFTKQVVSVTEPVIDVFGIKLRREINVQIYVVILYFVFI